MTMDFNPGDPATLSAIRDIMKNVGNTDLQFTEVLEEISLSDALTLTPPALVAF